MTLRLATRGSPLALWQAEAVAAALRRDDPALEVRLVEVKTEGDRVVDRPIAEVGVQGAFTVEVDQAVRDGRADAAVHSLKDLATTPTPGLALAATLPRGSAEDALLAPRFGAFERLPPEAVVATGSPRRRAQLRRLRPDLRFVDVRGNIATRLARLDSGACDAMVLARAGLERLGLAARISETFSFERVLPAAGQALVGVTCRADDAALRGRLASAGDPSAFACGAAERALLRTLRAGCHAPVGAFATAAAGRLRLVARVLALDGSREVSGEIEGPEAGAESLGVALAERLIEAGAAPLLGGLS